MTYEEKIEIVERLQAMNKGDAGFVLSYLDGYFSTKHASVWETLKEQIEGNEK